MQDVWHALADPNVAILVAGAIVTIALQGLKKVWPWLSKRATVNKKRYVAATGALLTAAALQIIAGKALPDIDWCEVFKVAAGAFFTATGVHTVAISSAYKTDPEEGEGA